MEAIAARYNGTIPRIRRRARDVFDNGSLRTHAPISPRLGDINNRQGRAAEAAAFQLPDDDVVLDIVHRRRHLTGRKIKLGLGEIHFMPKCIKTKLLYYLMDAGERDRLHITINDIGDLSVDSYREFKEDVTVLKWLIDSGTCKSWTFAASNVCCNECISRWRLKVRMFNASGSKS